MRRLVVTAVALLALAAAPADAATKRYSTGNIKATIPAAGTLQRAISVPDRGPVSFVRVSFRLDHPNDAELAISLVAPGGTEVPLVVRRGPGANFGGQKRSCGGIVTVVDSDLTYNPIAEGTPPFTDSPYQAEGDLRKLYGSGARGRWRLKIVNSGPSTGGLYCFSLDISRAVPQTMRARNGTTAATLSYVERNGLFSKLRLKIVRGGKVAVDSPLRKIGCRDCAGSRPLGLEFRDLDGDGPELLVNLYSGGAHCCMLTLVLRWDAVHGRYRSTLGYWGNYGSKLIDLDHDGLPEFSAHDERFVYTFTAYVFSTAPIQIWRYRQGKLVDVTRDFPAQIRKNSVGLRKTYEKERKDKDVDVRALVAAYVADQYLLGRADEARRFLDLALKRGDLGKGEDYLGSPSGKSFVSELMRYLRRWGYIRS